MEGPVVRRLMGPLGAAFAAARRERPPREAPISVPPPTTSAFLPRMPADRRSPADPATPPPPPVVEIAPRRTARLPPVLPAGAASSMVALPEGVLPEGVLPEGVLPEGVLPEGVLPEGVLPEGVLPEGVLPEGVLPEAMLPE